MNTRKMFARGVSGTARLVYDRCCGAFLLFVAVTVAMLALQHANGAMGDVIPWPKGIQACVMFVLWANIGVAMVVSLFRRKWARAFGQFLLVAVAFVGLVFVGFVSLCVPTRMTSAPSAAWTQKCICDVAQVECSRLVFCGGISTRDGRRYFVVKAKNKKDVPYERLALMAKKKITEEDVRRFLYDVNLVHLYVVSNDSQNEKGNCR